MLCYFATLDEAMRARGHNEFVLRIGGSCGGFRYAVSDRRAPDVAGVIQVLSAPPKEANANLAH